MKLSPVTCAACGWSGKRKPGKLVQCPKCGNWAAYQVEAA
jgi:transposase